MLEKKHTVEFVKPYSDWKVGDRADFSTNFTAFLEVHGYARIVGTQVRQKTKKATKRREAGNDHGDA